MQNQPKDIVSGPAIGLIVTGVLNALLGLLSILSYLVRLNRGELVRIYANDAERLGALTGQLMFVVAGILGILTAPLIIFGAFRMLNRKNYSLAKAAAILAIIPCTSPCCLAGIPLGIWAMITLNKTEVKASFDGPPVNPYHQM